MSQSKKDYRGNWFYKNVNKMINTLTNSRLSDMKHAKTFARIATLLVVASIALTYLSFIHANTDSQSYLNWSTASFMSALLSTTILSMFMDDKYWVYLFRTPRNQLDERQKQVYGRVTVKSYVTLVAVFVLSIFLLPGILSGFTLDASNQLMIPFEIIFYLLALPSMFAAWEKDS